MARPQKIAEELAQELKSGLQSFTGIFAALLNERTKASREERAALLAQAKATQTSVGTDPEPSSTPQAQMNSKPEVAHSSPKIDTPEITASAPAPTAKKSRAPKLRLG